MEIIKRACWRKRCHFDLNQVKGEVDFNFSATVVADNTGFRAVNSNYSVYVRLL